MLGSWFVEPRRNIISKNEIEKHLENRLMQTLVFLAKHSGEVVSRDQFFATVWQGLVVNEEALSRAISLLRTALGDNANKPIFIRTIPGVGYQLIQSPSPPTGLRDKEFPVRASHKHSIAVLPFVNLSEDSENEYFSDGITEEILNVLAQVERFKVVGRTSSFAFKNRNEDLREIGSMLGVAHVLEGSVRKAGDRVRITAQLIKTQDGFHLWSMTFDRRLDDIFAIQDEIASAVTKALKIKLLGNSSDWFNTEGTRNTQAFQAYLLGVHFRNRGALKESVEQAATAFERAIEFDPLYAKAHAGLAYTWNDRVWNGYVNHEKGLEEVKSAANRAIELEPDLADGYLALGLALQLEYVDKRSAGDLVKTALRLRPGNAQVLIEFSRINCNLGNWDISIEAARDALELEPVSVYANHFLGHVLYFARRFDEAISVLRKTLELDPHYPKPHYFISMSLHWMGDSDAALEEIAHEPLNWMQWTASATILNHLGRHEEAKVHLKHLVAYGSQDNTFIQQCNIYAQSGDIERALRCLGQAFDLRDPGLTQLAVDRFLDPIRDEPGFVEILGKVGFPTV